MADGVAPRSSATRATIAVVLAVAVVVAFGPVLGNDFINLDDDKYVTLNPRVQQGFTLASLRWAWTTSEFYWHPLTWLSHMLDWRLFGAAPAGHHATSLVLHAANTLLLFFLLDRLTGAPWRSALVAALFGLHPLRVESVAWVAERKDVLSTCFWLLTTHAYVTWVRRPSLWRYALVVAGLAFGLMAKPMLVTLPATLLLLDYWPLGRLGAPGTLWPRVREKLPLLPLVVASCAVTILLEHQGAVRSLALYPLAVRVENALVSWVSYLGMTLWPRDLAVLYPHPRGTIPLWKTGGSALMLAALTTMAARARRRHPHLLVGWLWYLGTLLPVIGLVQAGEQALADRFTYVPLIGLFVAGAFALPNAPPGARRIGVAGAVTGVLLALAVATRTQLAHWRDSVTLFEHTLTVEEHNPVAHTNLGFALAQRGEADRAMAHLVRANALRPANVKTHVALGNLLLERGQVAEATAEYTTALDYDPNSVHALTNLGHTLASQGRSADAIAYYDRALGIDPTFTPAHRNLGLELVRHGRQAEAVVHLEEAVRADPRDASAHSDLGVALLTLGRGEQGLAQLARAIEAQPDHAQAHGNRVLALLQLGRFVEAWAAVADARRHGIEPPEAVVRALAERMPEPAR